MEYVKCELCGSDNCRDLFAYGDRSVVQCKACGLIYKNPRLSSGELLKKYINDEYSPGSRSKLSKERKQIFEDGLAKIEKVFKSGVMLDVGCGYGEFLAIARDRGWNVQGLEVSKTSSGFARDILKIPVFNGSLKDAKFNSDHFDVVAVWDVLDQLTDPAETLKEIYGILKPGGLLVIRVRNANFHVNVKKLFKSLTVMIHEYSFSPHTIKEMLKRSGFHKSSVLNARLSSEYPFSILFEFLCNIIFLISFCKAILSPSIVVFTRKEA